MQVSAQKRAVAAQLAGVAAELEVERSRREQVEGDVSHGDERLKAAARRSEESDSKLRAEVEEERKR